MNHLKIEQKDTGGYSVSLDGVEISERLAGVSVELHAARPAAAALIYKCHPQSMDADAEITHYCPEELRP